jgi:ornithine cyclodeaminase
LRVLILSEDEIRELITPSLALSAVREAFTQHAVGAVTMPAPIEVDFDHQHADLHVKGAYLHGSPFFSFKVVTGFYENAARGLPVTNGINLLFDAGTGQLYALLFDNGYLTELRTGSAGALAAQLLARPVINRMAIIGTGVQARFQLESLMEVRRPEKVVVYGRNPVRAEECAREMRGRYDVEVLVAPEVRSAVEGAELIVTATTSRTPLVEADWLMPGAHVTAVGSDLPEKQELSVAVLSRADVLVADSVSQCVTSGEIHHAVEAGVIRVDEISAELGQVAAGMKAGRTSDHQITVADLTGLGIQDAAVAAVVGAAASNGVLGRSV